MPAIITDKYANGGPVTKKRVDRKYRKLYKQRYPKGLSLRPGSDAHKKLVNLVMTNARNSNDAMSKRRSQWRKIDEVTTGFIALDEDEIKVKSKDSRKPVSVIFPQTLATLETMHAYMNAVFLKNPLFEYVGTGPEDVIGAKLLTKVVGDQAMRNKSHLGISTLIRDSLMYGMGGVTPYWHQQYGTKIVKEQAMGFPGQGLFGVPKQTRRVERDALLYEGTQISNLDPYNILFDVNVPVHEAKKGDYYGWVESVAMKDLLADEKRSPELFNCLYVNAKKTTTTTLGIGRNESGRDSRTGRIEDSASRMTDHVDLVKMYVKIIPKDMGMGSSPYPELWYFTVAGEDVIIEAEMLGEVMDDLDIVTVAPDTDGYSISPISRVESQFGLQGVLDFMFNSHVKNVRKSIHDMFLVDPYQVNLNDIKNPDAGRLIRLRRPVWGKGVKNAMSQLPVTDVTRGNVNDAMGIANIMGRLSGADESMQGAQREGGPERLTGAEFQATRNSSLGRLKRYAQIFSFQGMQDLGITYAKNVQRYMSQQAYIDVVGVLPDQMAAEYAAHHNRMAVSPFDLIVDHDVLVSDGSMPGVEDTQAWNQAFQTIANSEALQEEFDLSRIFKHMARNMGASDIDQFVKVKVVPDEQALAMQQSGQAVPATNAALGELNATAGNL